MRKKGLNINSDLTDKWRIFCSFGGYMADKRQKQRNDNNTYVSCEHVCEPKNESQFRKLFKNFGNFSNQAMYSR